MDRGETSVVVGMMWALFLGASASCLGSQMPSCPARGYALPINNEQVLKWERTTRNQFLARAHVSGTVLRIYPQGSHAHFSLQIGPARNQTVEIIYNEDFGELPPVKEGDQIEACGDYKTSNRSFGHYPASPDGAIVHWVHRSNDESEHPSGFLAVNGVLYGER